MRIVISGAEGAKLCAVVHCWPATARARQVRRRYGSREPAASPWSYWLMGLSHNFGIQDGCRRASVPSARPCVARQLDPVPEALTVAIYVYCELTM